MTVLVVKSGSWLTCFPVLQLPDGQEIQVGPDRFKVPEVLFNPVGHHSPKDAIRLSLAHKKLLFLALKGVNKMPDLMLCRPSRQN